MSCKYRLVCIELDGTDGEVLNLPKQTKSYFPRLLIGSQPTCDVQVRSSRVSNIHAALSLDASGRWKVADESEPTSCGTVVNGVRIMVKDDHILEHNDVLGIGKRSFRFEKLMSRLATNEDATGGSRRIRSK